MMEGRRDDNVSPAGAPPFHKKVFCHDKGRSTSWQRLLLSFFPDDDGKDEELFLFWQNPPSPLNEISWFRGSSPVVSDRDRGTPAGGCLLLFPFPSSSSAQHGLPFLPIPAGQARTREGTLFSWARIILTRRNGTEGFPPFSPLKGGSPSPERRGPFFPFQFFSICTRELEFTLPS